MRCKNFIKILRKVLLTGKEGEEEEKKNREPCKRTQGHTRKSNNPFGGSTSEFKNICERSG